MAERVAGFRRVSRFCQQVRFSVELGDSGESLAIAPMIHRLGTNFSPVDKVSNMHRANVGQIAAWVIPASR